MFLLSFTLSLAIYTIWLNAPLGMMISAGVLGILLLVCGWKRQRKQCGRIFAGNLLALLLISGNLLRRNTDDGSKDDLHSFRYGITPPVSSSPTFEDKPTPTQRETFNGFGTIIDTQKYHVYLFEDEKGNVRRLSSKQTYHIGDQLFLSASLLRLQLQKVFNANFIPPRTAEFWDYQFNYDKRIFMKGIAGTAYEKQSILVNPQHPGTINGTFPPERKLGGLERIRAGMQTYVEHIYGQNQYAGLLLGLLIGDKSLIPTEQYDTFVESGLVHIIAVSGGNIAMVVILLSFLLKWIPLYVRNGLIIVMIGGYAMICGGDSSVIRAALMGSLTLIALFWGREISIRRTMKYALGGILLFSPFSLVYDVGLLLSFSAIMGIVLVQKLSEQYALHLQPLATRSGNIQQGKKAGLLQSKFWKEYVVPTIGASLGTAPVLLFFMNGVNVVGIVLNIVIVPLIPVLTIYGFASLLLSALVQREGRIWGEVLMMKLVYGLSKFGKEYAIVVQAKNVVAKYVLMGLFIVGGIWGYRKVMQQQTPLK